MTKYTNRYWCLWWYANNWAKYRRQREPIENVAPDDADPIFEHQNHAYKQYGQNTTHYSSSSQNELKSWPRMLIETLSFRFYEDEDEEDEDGEEKNDDN
jgi:hypothetical protein